ncbi:MAG: hypothetical protein IJX72_03800, partial [Clostridia bacterium]|nr:hypothetical protein [Clostridia bacterium]
MKYIIMIVGALIALLMIADFISALRERKRSDRGRVYLPGVFAVIGGVCGGFFLIPTFITLFGDESVWLSFGFLCFSALGGVLSLAHLNCRITYDENGFTHKNIFGIKRTYTYDEITGLKEGNHEDLIYMGHHFAVIDEFAMGCTEFLLMAKKRYHVLSGGKMIPRIKKKKDIFNGHVTDGGGLIVVYILVGVLALGLLGFVTAYVYFIPPTNENTELRETVFTACEREGDTLILISNEDWSDVAMEYRVRFVDDGVDVEKIQAVCDGKTTATVYVDTVTPKNEKPYFAIKAMRVRDTDILTFAESQRLH